MAVGALKRVGCGRDAVVGYFPHALQQASLAVIPGWLAAIVIGKEATHFERYGPGSHLTVIELYQTEEDVPYSGRA
jgi:hypothetical protein